VRQRILHGLLSAVSLSRPVVQCKSTLDYWADLQEEAGGIGAFDTEEEQLVRLWTLQAFMKQADNIVSKL
jgi:hypothetical protein